MKEAYWGYWLIILGVFILVVMMFTQSNTTSNTQDYLQLKEVTEAALYDSVDDAYFRLYGDLKIDKEAFVENFLKRFADTVSINNTYKIEFFDLYESPPKVSVQVTSTGGSFLIAGTSDNVSGSTNRIDMVLEENIKSYCDYFFNENFTATDVSSDVCYNDGLDGVRFVAMKATDIYDSQGTKIGTMNADGTKYTITGCSNNNRFKFKYGDQDGYVNTDYIAVNLQDYIKEMDFEIFNQSSAQYRSNGNSLSGITGKKLYNNDYMPVAVYSFAKKLKVAAQAANKDGVRLKVNDAYRPYDVSTYIYNIATKDTNFINAVNGNPGWFLASSFSKHNTACAVDITISGQESNMPTSMHELGMSAMKYTSFIETRRESPNSSRYSSQMKASASAIQLHKYMYNAGLEDLPSEWWHYQDDQCHGKINQPSSFWKNV